MAPFWGTAGPIVSIVARRLNMSGSKACAAQILFIRQQIIESFDPYNRHNHADPFLVVRKVVHH
jgi:hypothetical protein